MGAFVERRKGDRDCHEGGETVMMNERGRLRHGLREGGCQKRNGSGQRCLRRPVTSEGEGKEGFSWRMSRPKVLSE